MANKGYEEQARDLRSTWAMLQKWARERHPLVISGQNRRYADLNYWAYHRWLSTLNL